MGRQSIDQLQTGGVLDQDKESSNIHLTSLFLSIVSFFQTSLSTYTSKRDKQSMGTGAGGKKQKKKYCIKSSIGHLSGLLDRPSILYPPHQTSPISIPNRIKKWHSAPPVSDSSHLPFLPFLSYAIYLSGVSGIFTQETKHVSDKRKQKETDQCRQR